MDYEKKYKEAQKWIESIYSELSHEQQMEAEAFFPELKESEDERIRKTLIRFFKDNYPNETEMYDGTVTVGKALAWFEKQSEQKLANKVEPWFQVGDWVVTSYGKVNQVIAVDKDGDGFTLDDDTYFSGSWKDGYHLWTIKDAKDGDVLCVKYGNDEMPFIFTGKQDNVAYCALNSFGEFVLSIAEWLLKTSVLPATKEQRDTLFAKMKEAGYEWSEDTHELKKIEQKSTNESLTDVGHEYYSNLLSNDNSDNIDEYAYQCAYCMSHDWMKETATWEDVQKAVKLGAEWQKQKPTRTQRMTPAEAEEAMYGKPAEWSEEDNYNSKLILSTISQDQDLSLETKDKLTSWLKSLKDRVQSQPKQEWKQENVEELSDFENTMMHIGGSFFGENAGLDPNDTDTIKEQAELLLELVPKTKWSEEDELKRSTLIHVVKKQKGSAIFEGLLPEELINWLKSLKERYTWKPSDEQMDALEYYATSLSTYSDRQDDLFSLLKSLKKLKGE